MGGRVPSVGVFRGERPILETRGRALVVPLTSMRAKEEVYWVRVGSYANVYLEVQREISEELLCVCAAM